jgi:hypothetical protein
MVGDGTTFYAWTNIWAEECRRAQGLEILDPIQLPQAIWQDRKQVTKPSGHNAGKLEDHPEYRLLPFTPQGAPSKMTSLSHRGQVFYFSPESAEGRGVHHERDGADRSKMDLDQ